METSDKKTKDQLCKKQLKKIFREAENEASEKFNDYPEQVNIEFDCSVDDKITTAKRLLYYENERYNKKTNIRNIEKYKIHYLNHFIRTNEIYDKEMKFNVDGYESQKQSIMEQFLVVKKTDYLKNIISEFKKANESDKKIDNIGNHGRVKWLRGVSEFGLMILKLEEKGFIELPVGSNAEGSYEKLAEILFKTFEVTNSWNSFKDALNPERNRLGDSIRKKIEDFPENFPHASELGAVKKRKNKN